MPKKKIDDYRPDKQLYYMNIAKEVAARSTCMSAIHGAIVVRNDQIVATGYNGAPRHTKDCYEHGFCLRRALNIPSGKHYEICRSVHAEQNVLVNAARSGENVFGGDLYMWGMRVWEGANALTDELPCFICKKMIINSGIENIYRMTPNGKIKTIKVSGWANEWRRKDMLEDTAQYDAKYDTKLKEIKKKGK